VTGENFLENTSWFFVHVETVFELHGAPPHFSRPVRVFLDRKFPDLWRRSGESFLWPLRSPDLTSLEFFSSGGSYKTFFAVKSAECE
jgi:hypothetical protein